MRKFIAVMTLCSLAGWSTAEHFDQRFAGGYELLEQGDAQSALEFFQELKVDTPDSALVDYSIATAHYALGASNRDAENIEKASEHWVTAKNHFDRLINDDDPFLKENAPLNAANCSAQMARQIDPVKKYGERVRALKGAIGEYEKVLRTHPDNQMAKANTDHLRYLLKKMLQNPPPEQQEQDKGEAGQSENPGDEEEEGTDPQKGNREGEEEQEQDGAEDDQQSESEGEEEESDSPPQAGSSPQDQASDKQTESDENIEAILESLEEQNKEEQKNLRRATRRPQVGPGGKWW